MCGAIDDHSKSKTERAFADFEWAGRSERDGEVKSAWQKAELGRGAGGVATVGWGCGDFAVISA